MDIYIYDENGRLVDIKDSADHLTIANFSDSFRQEDEEALFIERVNTYDKHMAYLSELNDEHQDELDKAFALCFDEDDVQSEALRLSIIYSQRRADYCADNNFHPFSNVSVDDLPF